MQNNTSTKNTTTDTTDTGFTSNRGRLAARLAGAALAATAAVATFGTTAQAGQGSVEGAVIALSCPSAPFTGGVYVAMGDVDTDGDVDGNDFLVWQRHLGRSAPNGYFLADSFSFGAEQGETSDINIGVGELQECTISKSTDAGEQTYLKVELENVQITSYQLGSLDASSDLAVWQQNYGSTATSADYDGDGVVDGADFLTWQGNTTSADKEHDKWVIIHSMSLPIHK